jgi:2-polyprenyl-3-methyl-5-hydroxy-6-metoxy-1,4-benzoquinol methylase
MEYDQKRNAALKRFDVQQGNKDWWTAHTMTYDWKDPTQQEKFSRKWFDEIDRRFLNAAKLFSATENPFHELMGTGSLNGKRVLEIGCGMGFHAEMLASSGAELVTVDLSPTSVKATSKRFALKGLSAEIVEIGAENLNFPENSFDLVWSWGVIHHSSRTGCIVREIERVLKPSGVVKLMVYNLSGMPAYITMMTRYSFKFWSGASLDELLWASSDGFTARFYTKDLFADLLSTFFENVEINVLGLEPDAIPLPRYLRPVARFFVSDEKQRKLIRKRGAFLYATARKRS